MDMQSRMRGFSLCQRRYFSSTQMMTHEQNTDFIQSLRAFRRAMPEYLISSRTFLVSNCPKMAPTWHQKKQKQGQQPAQMGSRGAKIEPSWCKDGVKTTKTQDKRNNETKKRVAPHSTAPLQAKMMSIWPQLGSPNGAKMAKKIDPKLDHFFDVSWDRCLGGIWWIFGAKMEVSWHQNGIKN